jgi:cob(I)alamin adenosyltransferase
VKIYTRTGDAGETSLFGGTRVSKSDARVDAYGEVDELNACLGWALASLSAAASRSNSYAPVAEALVRIQRDLFALGARLADPTDTISSRMPKAVVADADVERLEQLIDRLETDLSPLAHFVLAGGVEAGARLHLARAVCRRAERRMVTLQPPIDALLIRYVNRLSDLLFVMARWVNHRAGVPEIEW